MDRSKRKPGFIPQMLTWALEDGHMVETVRGIRSIKRHRLADLVLPTGELSIGYPGEQLVNDASKTHLKVSAGHYSVFVSYVHHTDEIRTLLFVLVKFTERDPSSWEPCDGFFTDSGDGCLFDRTGTELLREKRKQIGWEAWERLKDNVIEGGDGDLLLDKQTGANAIVFRTNDMPYECYLGRDEMKRLACLVVAEYGIE